MLPHGPGVCGAWTCFLAPPPPLAPLQMFIGCPSEKFKYPLPELGGVRIVTGCVIAMKHALLC